MGGDRRARISWRLVPPLLPCPTAITRVARHGSRRRARRTRAALVRSCVGTAVSSLRARDDREVAGATTRARAASTRGVRVRHCRCTAALRSCIAPGVAGSLAASTQCGSPRRRDAVDDVGRAQRAAARERQPLQSRRGRRARLRPRSPLDGILRAFVRPSFESGPYASLHDEHRTEPPHITRRAYRIAARRHPPAGLRARAQPRWRPRT